MKTPLIRQEAAKAWQEFRGNRRLQWGLLAVLAILIGEGGLRWADSLSRQGEEARKLNADLVLLRSQTRSEPVLRQTLADLQATRKSVDEKLWSVPSEAVGQARLKEWLEDTLKKTGATGASLSLSSVRAAGNKEEPASAAAEKGQQESLREFRAIVRMHFAPGSLEKLLAEIEAGEAFAGVESLTVNRRERRVEVMIFVLMRVAATAAPTEGR